MRENQASTTARFMAFFRAVESAKAPNRRLFCDSLAAGYDARPYRLPELADVCVFEVDHPATQAVKQTLLGAPLALNHPKVTFVPLDFNRESLGSALAASRVDATRLAFVIWEGVTNYLTAEAVDQTLRVVAGLAPGSQLAFTYVQRAVLEGLLDIRSGQRLARTLRRVGERWTFGLDPADVPGYLRARGLALEEDVDSVTYRRRYLGAGARELRGYEFYHVARAQVLAGALDSVRAGAGDAAS